MNPPVTPSLKVEVGDDLEDAGLRCGEDQARLLAVAEVLELERAARAVLDARVRIEAALAVQHELVRLARLGLKFIHPEIFALGVHVVLVGELALHLRRLALLHDQLLFLHRRRRFDAA